MNDFTLNIEEGIIILLVGIVIVFTALLLLFALFQYAIPPLLSFSVKKIYRQIRPGHEEEPVKKYDSGEEIAAASAAVYMFLEEVHDQENAIITISKSVKDYSPWSSKIYVTHFGLRDRTKNI